MRRGALLAVAVLTLAGCGQAKHAQHTVSRPTTTTAAGFDVGVVGPLSVSVSGVHVSRGTLATLSGQPLVLASAAAARPQAVSAAAAADPSTHFVLVGASTTRVKQPNLVGIVFRDDQAAQLGGILAAFVAQDEGGRSPRVAWIGPGTARTVDAFRTGVHRIDPAVTVLVESSSPAPARCKEAALTSFLREAVAVMAGRGLCAEAVAEVSAEQNRVAIALGDFELPEVAVDTVVRAALSGVYSGGEDLVFGLASGAIGVRRLDPRVPLDAAVQVRRLAQSLASGA